MKQDELKNRTKQFALRIIRLTQALPHNFIGKAMGNQLIRCGTSVGANYRAACRGRSKAEFISKLNIVLEEADESIFWLELIIESKIMDEKRVKKLLLEANELTAIFVATLKTTKINLNNKKYNN